MFRKTDGTKIYDGDGNYLGTLEELYNNAAKIFKDSMKEAMEIQRQQYYGVAYSEPCKANFLVTRMQGCKTCPRYKYCNSWQKIEP